MFTHEGVEVELAVDVYVTSVAAAKVDVERGCRVEVLVLRVHAPESCTNVGMSST